MSGKIKKLTIVGLYGSTNISVPIKDNQLILVGKNGLGKSTFINFLFFILSKQWTKLVEADFTSVKLETSDGQITLERSALSEELRWRDEGINRFPQRYIRFLNELRDEGKLGEFFQTKDESALREYAARLGTPSIMSIRRFRDDAKQFYPTDVQSVIRAASKFIDSLVGDRQILYLPTYRRIEKDLRIVIPELDEYIKRYNDSPSRTKTSTRAGGAYLELVEFGMEDVQKKFDDTISELKDNARQVFNELAGSYLRDVIRGQGQTYNKDEILVLKDGDVKDILNRVEENTLSEPDKRLLQESIARLSDPSNSTQDDAYIAHIFSKLISTSRALQEKETPLRKFINACNKYLEGKRIIYNEMKYLIDVFDEKGRRVDLQYLSSGEKQIVSLFSHLYLGYKRTYMIIIDEPELSLSMPWQHTFLPDIMSSGHCDFIAAVTHSPFISDNDFDKYTIDMKKCVKSS